MKALVLEANGHLFYKEIDMPVKLTKNSYLIRVTASGICGSDIHRGFEDGAYHYPLVMGHEFSGIIKEIPASGCKYAQGQRVVVFPVLPCRKCRACETGDYAQCTNYNYFGSRCNGGFAEYVWVPEENLFPLPDYVNIIHAAMTEPCAVALHGVRKFRIIAGETAAVYGGGPIGLMAAQWLRIRGCSSIIIIDIDNSKLKIAESLGFTVINAKKKDPVKALLEFTNREGVDKVVEACGLPLTYRQAVQSAGRFGEVLFLGNIKGDFILGQKEFSDILRRELVLHGTWNSKIIPRGKDDWSTVLYYMDKEMNVAPLISHTPKLSEGAAIFHRIVDREESFNKVIFTLD